jgi:hypothetical protein
VLILENSNVNLINAVSLAVVMKVDLHGVRIFEFKQKQVKEI